MGIVYEYFSRKILWEHFKIISYGIYTLIIILYLINPALATLTLFFYISLWSRIPCMVSDFTKDLDVVDFFSVLIATQLSTPLSGVYAAIFSVTAMLFSRLFGPDEDFAITIIETIAFLLCSLITPFVYSATGGNLFMTLIIFTIQRYVYEWIIVLIFFRQLIFLATLATIIGIPIAYIMNKFVMIILGPFFSSVFKTGLKFNLPLFLFATILTFSVHYITKYMIRAGGAEPIMIEEEKTKTKAKKIMASENNVADDNYKNYPELFE